MWWIGVCLWLDFGDSGPQPHVRMGVGRYRDTVPVHAQAQAGPNAGPSLNLVAPDAGLPLPPLQQFLRCRR